VGTGVGSALVPPSECLSIHLLVAEATVYPAVEQGLKMTPSVDISALLLIHSPLPSGHWACQQWDHLPLHLEEAEQ
jgi:hypothetical protein